MTDLRLYAPATLRNRDAIFAVLDPLLASGSLVLELASGSGEHAASFAERRPDVTFQPSDPDPDARASIAAWAAALKLANLREPLLMDAAAGQWPIERADAMMCINMIHISPWAATLGLFAGAAKVLPARAPLLLYGPYRREGGHTAPSNAEFDASLKARNPAWGVRDLEAVIDVAVAAGFSRPEIHQLPSNNLAVVYRRVP